MERVQLSRAKGWRMPPNTVKVDRSTRWGNPYRACEPPHGPRWAVQEFRAYAAKRAAEQPEWIESLQGKNLACWCGFNDFCHADVLLEMAAQPNRSSTANADKGNTQGGSND